MQLESQIVQKVANSVYKMILKKKFKKQNITKKLKKYCVTKVKLILWTYSVIFCPIRDHIFKTVFPKIIFLFSVLGSIFSRNRCKLSRKLRNAPLRSRFQIFMKIN